MSNQHVHLVLDFGNTRDKAAIFSVGETSRQMSWQQTYAPRLDLSELGKICKEYAPHAAILSTTYDERPELRNWLAQRLKLILLDHNTPLPFTNNYQTPETLGRDRIAALAGGRAHIKQGPFLVINAGTCITYDALDQDDTYLGGGIAPGTQLRLRAMHTFTSRLPLVELNWQDAQAEHSEIPLIGRTTAESMLSGAVNGVAAEMDGIIERYRDHFPELKVLLTGGDTPYFESKLKNQIFALRYLVLQGLDKILNFNAL